MEIENVIVFGAGAAGSNLLLNLLCTNPELNYTVVDFDKVELRNITPGTQPYSKADLNRPKVQALQRIAQQQREKRIEAINQRMNTVQEVRALFKTPETIVIDAFDNAPSRNLLFHCNKHPGRKVEVLHVGFSHEMAGEVIWNESYSEMVESKADAKIDVCEMNLARPFINALTGIAGIICWDFITSGKKYNAYFDRNLKVMKF